jgi:hypothetical protein
MQRLAARLGIHYGWVVAATTFLTMLVTAGAMGAPGVLIDPLKYEFGWTNSRISVAFAVRPPRRSARASRARLTRVTCLPSSPPAYSVCWPR